MRHVAYRTLEQLRLAVTAEHYGAQLRPVRNGSVSVRPTAQASCYRAYQQALCAAIVQHRCNSANGDPRQSLS